MKRTYCPNCTACVKFPDGRDNTKGKCPSCSKIFTLIAVGENLPSIMQPQPQVSHPVVETKSCIFCGEQIAKSAIKCKHCNEFLDGSSQIAKHQQPTIVVAEEPKVPLRKSKREMDRIREEATSPNKSTINNQMIVNVSQSNGSHPRWSRIVAGFLSLVFPGLGQLYKGQIFNGLLWAAAVVAGYIFLIFPGACLHLICVLGAMSGNTHR